MKKLVVLFAVMASQVAMADGFVCQTDEGDLNVRVYNQTQPELGTRSVAAMIISDPAVSHGRKTIAKFTSAKGTVSSSGLLYKANVDLRFADSRAKGENIGGTKLGELDQVVLSLDYTYDMAVADGSLVSGELTLVKRNGQEIVKQVTCERYLKN